MILITRYFGELESGKRVDLLTSKRDLSFRNFQIWNKSLFFVWTCRILDWKREIKSLNPSSTEEHSSLK